MCVSKMLGIQGALPSRLGRQRMTDWDHRASRDVDQVIGAFFLVRRDLFDELRGFDERFFVYFEEVDFSYRAYQLGYRSHFLSTARALHRGGGCSNQVKSRRLAYSVISRIEYALKHFGWHSAAALVTATLCVEPVTRSAAALMRGAPSGFKETIAGFREVWRAGPKYLRRAFQSRNHRSNLP
jgi:GT2 family glycosyltransferase